MKIKHIIIVFIMSCFAVSGRVYAQDINYIINYSTYDLVPYGTGTPIYSTQAEPAQGVPYVDSYFNTTVTRLTNAATEPFG